MTGVCWDTGCDIAVIGVDGTGFVQLHPGGTNDNAHSPTWSPDGLGIAFTIEGRRRNSEVVIVRFEGNGFGEIVHLTDGYAPSWR
jgi:Tol biopolymer transport system component